MLDAESVSQHFFLYPMPIFSLPYIDASKYENDFFPMKFPTISTGNIKLNRYIPVEFLYVRVKIPADCSRRQPSGASQENTLFSCLSKIYTLFFKIFPVPLEELWVAANMRGPLPKAVESSGTRYSSCRASDMQKTSLFHLHSTFSHSLPGCPNRVSCLVQPTWPYYSTQRALRGPVAFLKRPGVLHASGKNLIPDYFPMTKVVPKYGAQVRFFGKRQEKYFFPICFPADGVASTDSNHSPFPTVSRVHNNKPTGIAWHYRLFPL